MICQRQVVDCQRFSFTTGKNESTNPPHSPFFKGGGGQQAASDEFLEEVQERVLFFQNQAVTIYFE